VTSLRLLWFYLAELFSGRLTRRVRRIEMELERQEKHHAAWETAHMRLEGFTKSKTQALSREVGKLQLSVHALAVRTADSMSMERALTLDEDEETECVITLDEDSKT
jgi:hypothetical protein